MAIPAQKQGGRPLHTATQRVVMLSIVRVHANLQRNAVALARKATGKNEQAADAGECVRAETE